MTGVKPTVPPIEKFNTWLASEAGQTKAKEIAATDGIGSAFVRAQLPLVRTWLVANENTGKARKKDWGKFLANWVRRALSNSQRPVGRRLRQNYQESCDI